MPPNPDPQTEIALLVSKKAALAKSIEKLNADIEEAHAAKVKEVQKEATERAWTAVHEQGLEQHRAAMEAHEARIRQLEHKGREREAEHQRRRLASRLEAAETPRRVQRSMQGRFLHLR